MRIFFIGTVVFSYYCLEALLEAGHNIVGVATKSDSSINADYKDLQPICEQYNVPLKVVRDINHINNIRFIENTHPDIIYCFGWSNLLKKEVLAIAPKGIIGFHPAEIPHNKGRHPIIWALCLGLETTASSFFFMDEGADTGDILSQQKITISDTDTAMTLYSKITDIAIQQILQFTIQLEAGTAQRIKQISHTGNTWRKRGKVDGKIDFRMSTRSIYNLVRSLTIPYIGAHCTYEGVDMKIWSAEVTECSQPNLEPGKIIASDEVSFTVKTGDGAIKIIDHEFIQIPTIGTYL